MAGDWMFWVGILQYGDITYSPTLLNFFRKSENNTRQYQTLESKLLNSTEVLAVANYLHSRQLTNDSIWTRSLRWLRFKILILAPLVFIFGKPDLAIRSIRVFFGETK